MTITIKETFESWERASEVASQIFQNPELVWITETDSIQLGRIGDDNIDPALTVLGVTFPQMPRKIEATTRLTIPPTQTDQPNHKIVNGHLLLFVHTIVEVTVKF